MTIRRCVLAKGHDTDETGRDRGESPHMFADEDRPRLRHPGAQRCEVIEDAELEAHARELVDSDALRLAEPTPIDVAAEQGADRQVCPHCGFAPVSHEEWKRTVLEHYGANAGAVLVEMTQRAFDLGRMAGKLEAEATRVGAARSERAKIAERLRAMHAARVRSSTPLHVDLEVLADDVENDRPLAFVE